MRPDEPHAVMNYADRHPEGKALLVLGGPSAKNWEAVRDEIGADVIIGANGVNNKIKDLDFWICAENMTYPNQKALEGEQRYIDIMKMFQRTGPKVRLVSWKTYDLLNDKNHAIKMKRQGYNYDMLGDFTFREYGDGLMNGAMLDLPETGVPLRVGTVALQMMHFAGILGVSEIHTIGYDLCLKKDHHWYKYPKYEKTRFYSEGMFIKYKGFKTLWLWVKTLDYLHELTHVFKRDEITWKDHSDGLLQKEKGLFDD